jgi:cyclophilin family peptidyl-prolyl cis-trans isomerase
MANSGADSDGSQFFITVGPAPWLTHKHTIFGMVVDGMRVADTISEVPVDSQHRPIENVMLKTVRISGDLMNHTQSAPFPP